MSITSKRHCCPKSVTVSHGTWIHIVHQVLCIFVIPTTCFQIKSNEKQKDWVEFLRWNHILYKWTKSVPSDAKDFYFFFFSVEILPKGREYISLPSSAEGTVHNAVCSWWLITIIMYLHSCSVLNTQPFSAYAWESLRSSMSDCELLLLTAVGCL